MRTAVTAIKVDAFTRHGGKGVSLPLKREVLFESDPTLDHIQVVVRAPAEDEEVLSLLERLTEAPNGGFTVYDRAGNARILSPEEVITASMEGKMVHVVTADGSWFTRRTLQSLEGALVGRRFVRVSRHELVNLDKVSRYDFTIAGSLRLELVGGMETWASRRCIPDIRKRLQGKE